MKGLVSTAMRKDASSSPLMSPKNHKSAGEGPASPTHQITEQKHPQVSKLKEAAGDESDNSMQRE